MNMPIDSFLDGVAALAQQKEREHGPLKDRWHAHGLLLEEKAELFDQVRLNETARFWERVWLELLDIGVCCLRWAALNNQDTERLIEKVEERFYSGKETAVANLHSAYALIHNITFNLIDRAHSNYQVAGWLEKLLVICALTAVDVVHPKLNKVWSSSLS